MAFAARTPVALLRCALCAQALLIGALGSVGFSCQRSEDVRATQEAPRGEPRLAETATKRQSELALASLREAPSSEEPAPPACSEGMLLVEGDYCPKVQLNCKKYMDPEGRYEQFRCAEYGPTRCLSKERKHLRFCIDRTEFTEQGQSLPANHRSFTHGEKVCAARGQRMCRESEWNFACEGEEMRPYPYGFSRDGSACNADRMDVVSPEGKLRDLRAPGGSFARCKSPFGVMDMAGNLEEFVAIDGAGPARPAMKGAYWQPSRNFCRAAQTAHDRYYNGTETGFRCCGDAD